MARRKLSYVCKFCHRPFHRLGCYRRHIRTHQQELPDSPIKPPNQLLSRKSDGEGIFDFDGVLDCEDNCDMVGNLDSDVDSFYSDFEFHRDETIDTLHSTADSDADSNAEAVANDDSDAESDDNEDNNSDINSEADDEDCDTSDDTYIPSPQDTTTMTRTVSAMISKTMKFQVMRTYFLIILQDLFLTIVFQSVIIYIRRHRNIYVRNTLHNCKSVSYSIGIR